MNSSVVLCLQLVLLAITFKFYECFPGGAPDAVCDTLVPSANKHASKPQTSKSPYEFKPVKDNRSVTITIASPDGSTFRGFAVQARPANGTLTSIGTFSGDTTVSHTIDCFGNKDNAITHKDNKDKQSVTVNWLAPDSDKDIEVIFFGSVVKTKTEFWTNITTDRIVISGSTGGHPNHNHATDAPNSKPAKDLTSGSANNSNPFYMFLIVSVVSVILSNV